MTKLGVRSIDEVKLMTYSEIYLLQKWYIDEHIKNIALQSWFNLTSQNRKEDGSPMFQTFDEFYNPHKKTISKVDNLSRQALAKLNSMNFKKDEEVDKSA